MVAYTLALVLTGLLRIAVSRNEPGHLWQALVATAAYLPILLWLVLSLAEGQRPRRAGLALAVVGVVNVGMIPVIGADWLGTLQPLAALCLVVPRPPWSFVLFGGCAAAEVPLALAFDAPEWAVFYPFGVLVFGGSLALPLWLIGAARQLHAARLELAAEAVVRERLRIDGELRQTVGAALESIATAGDRAGALAVRDPAAAERELDTLVGISRRALSETRRMLTRYQRVVLRTELDTATALLTAAGIETRLELPDELPEELPEEVRSALRRVLGRILADATLRRCVVTVSAPGGRVRIELCAEGAENAGIREVIAP